MRGAAPSRMRRRAAFERRLEDQLVIELKLADDPLDPIEGRLILEDGDDAFAIGFFAAGGGALTAVAALTVNSLPRRRLRRRVFE